MTVEELKRHLEYTKNKHRNDFVSTGGTNISIMCEDILATIENLEAEIRADERAKVIEEFLSECESASYIPIGYGYYVVDCKSIRKIAEILKTDKQ